MQHCTRLSPGNHGTRASSFCTSSSQNSIRNSRRMHESTGGPHERLPVDSWCVQLQPGALHWRKDMEHRRLIDDAWTYNSNLRAEDGSQMQDRKSAFRELMLVPIGFLCATLLLILLMSHSGFGQAGSGRNAGSVNFNCTRFGTSSIYYFNDRYNLERSISQRSRWRHAPGQWLRLRCRLIRHRPDVDLQQYSHLWRKDGQ
jgi:hypothetical protein